MSGATLAIHAGQLKTATTSMQAVLWESRDRLAEAGVSYRPAVGRYHNRETYSLLAADPEWRDGRTARLQHTIRVALSDGTPYWPDFVDAVRRHEGLSLMSCEGLSFARPRDAVRLAGDLDGIGRRIVITTRPLSQMIVSAYAEWAKKHALPDLDETARRVLVGLLRDGLDSRYSWMLAERVRSVWSPIATDGWAEIPFDANRMADYQAAVWTALGVEGVVPPRVRSENLSLPTAALTSWQRHLHRQGAYDPRVDGGTMARLLSHEAARRGRGRVRISITAEAAAAIDAAFPVAGPPEGRRDLEALLQTREPLTRLVGGVEGEFEDEIAIWDGLFARHRRIVHARITLARALGVKRSHSPDWDRFRDEAPSVFGFLDGGPVPPDPASATRRIRLRVRGSIASLRRRRSLGRWRPEELAERLEGIVAGSARLPVTVSVTSHRPRFPTLEVGLRSILDQDSPPERTILWVSRADRPHVPSGVEGLCAAGLEIRETAVDLGPAGKLLPALSAFPDGVVVTVDDDVLYPRGLLGRLWRGHRSHPDAVVCIRAHYLRFGPEGSLLDYGRWEQETRRSGADSRLFFTGHGGVLYPAHVLAADVHDGPSRERLCPTADDVWFNWMARVARTPIARVPGPPDRHNDVRRSQESSLMQANVEAGGNDQQIRALEDRYGRLDPVTGRLGDEGAR